MARSEVAVLDNANHAGGAQAAVNGDAPLGQLGGHHVGGADFLKAQLGVGMDIAADGGNGGGLRDNGINDLHRFCLTPV